MSLRHRWAKISIGASKSRHASSGQHQQTQDTLPYEPRRKKTGFLAHLSRRLIGELIVYPWSGVPRPSVCRPFTMLKHLLLRNRLADQSQILCGAFLGRGNEILFAAFGSHDQDGRHAHIWKKPFKNLLLHNSHPCTESSCISSWSWISSW